MSLLSPRAPGQFLAVVDLSAEINRLMTKIDDLEDVAGEAERG
jgi:hypothetical protein